MRLGQVIAHYNSSARCSGWVVLLVPISSAQLLRGPVDRLWLRLQPVRNCSNLGNAFAEACEKLASGVRCDYDLGFSYPHGGRISIRII